MRRLLNAILAPLDSSPVAEGLADQAWRWPLILALVFLATGRQILIIVYSWSWPFVFAEIWTELVAGLAICLVAMFVLASGRRETLGLRLSPRQGWRPWLRYTAVAGGLVALAGVPVGLLLWFGGAMTPTAGDPTLLAPAKLLHETYESLVFYPVYEELAYRVVACAGLAALFGRRAGLVISAVLFGLAHWQNPGPTNLIAGLAFGWAYLASGSIAVSVLWHSLGNLFVLLVNVAYALAASS
jgi:membrane protease YdiL (CAAX protease family)